HAANEVAGSFCGKQDLAIRPPVFLRRRNVNTLQAFLDGPRTFICCQNPLARGDQFSGYGFQIVGFHTSSPNRRVYLFSIIATNKSVASLNTAALQIIEAQAASIGIVLRTAFVRDS